MTELYLASLGSDAARGHSQASANSRFICLYASKIFSTRMLTRGDCGHAVTAGGQQCILPRAVSDRISYMGFVALVASGSLYAASRHSRDPDISSWNSYLCTSC